MEIIWNSIKSEFGKVHLFSWISKGNWKLLICSLDTWGCHFLRLSANSNNSTSSSRRNLNTEQILNHPCFNIIALASWTFLALHVIVDLSAEVYCFLFIPRHVNVIARMAPFIGRQIVEKRFLFSESELEAKPDVPHCTISLLMIFILFIWPTLLRIENIPALIPEKKERSICVRVLITAQSPTDFARGKCAWCVCAFPRRKIHVGEFNDLDVAPTKRKIT